MVPIGSPETSGEYLRSDVYRPVTDTCCCPWSVSCLSACIPADGSGIVRWTLQRGVPVLCFKCVCVTPESSTKPRMAVQRRSASQAVAELTAEGVTGFAGAIAAVGTAAVKVVESVFSIVKMFVDWWRGKVPQCKLVEGVPEIGGIVYKKLIVGHSKEPYEVEYRDPVHTITGFSCLPVDEKTPSPNAKKIKGGCHNDHVTILLTPVQEGEWGCEVLVFGIERKG